MRIQSAVMLLILGMGTSLCRAQTSSPSPPFILAATNISFASVSIRTNSTVRFLLADPRAVNVDELDQDLARGGTRSKRLIRIRDGTNVVAEGRLFGRVWAVRASGFILKFGSPEATEKAAVAMQDKGALVLPKPPQSPKAWTVY